jgi:hypothetical protein
MRSQKKRPWLTRRGGIVLLLAASLTGLIGVVAIGLEGGLLMDQRRRVQAVTDAAAMAAAVDLYENYPAHDGLDPSSTAKDCALNAAAKMGYAHDGQRTKITVNIPPEFGPHKGIYGYVEVMVQHDQPRFFSRLFGASDMVIKSRSVAKGRWASAKTGILVLDLHETEALKANGGGTVEVIGADIIVNSDDDAATAGDGTGTILRASGGGRFKLTGGVKSNTTLEGPVDFNQKPTPDPLAHLPLPTLPSTAQDARTMPANSDVARTYLDALGINWKDVGQFYILEPGRYDRMPNFNNNDVVILKQASAGNGGIYYLNDSGFTSTGATIVQDPTGGTTGGLMLYNDPTKISSGISITGGKVVIDPPTSGPYTGISIFQNRSANIDLSITGQGGMKIYGTFYAAGAPIKITGSDAVGGDVIGSQYISRTLQTGGNGKYKVDWSPQKTARIRELTLVE